MFTALCIIEEISSGNTRRENFTVENFTTSEVEKEVSQILIESGSKFYLDRIVKIESESDSIKRIEQTPIPLSDSELSILMNSESDEDEFPFDDELF